LNAWNVPGGSGGGGGGRVNRIWIPVENLGPTYSTSFGRGGLAGRAGGDSLFTSGQVALAARGGKPGVISGAYGARVAGGAGGSFSTGIMNGTGVNGSAGGGSYMQGGSPGAANTGDAGPGGGGGRGSWGGLSGAIQPGGNAATINGSHYSGSAWSAIPNAVQPVPLGGPTNVPHAGGGGGEGQHGGTPGGGGGGGYSYAGHGGQAGGVGGDGLALVEWA
jgi:hypothetical protein